MPHFVSEIYVADANRFLNWVGRIPQNSFSILDTVLWEKASFQRGLDLYLNTHMTGAEMEADIRRKRRSG